MSWVRNSHVAKTFSKIDIDSGTGPDGNATRVLVCALENWFCRWLSSSAESYPKLRGRLCGNSIGCWLYIKEIGFEHKLQNHQPGNASLENCRTVSLSVFRVCIGRPNFRQLILFVYFHKTRLRQHTMVRI